MGGMERACLLVEGCVFLRLLRRLGVQVRGGKQSPVPVVPRRRADRSGLRARPGGGRSPDDPGLRGQPQGTEGTGQGLQVGGQHRGRPPACGLDCALTLRCPLPLTEFSPVSVPAQTQGCCQGCTRRQRVPPRRHDTPGSGHKRGSDRTPGPVPRARLPLLCGPGGSRGRRVAPSRGARPPQPSPGSLE